MKPYSLALFIHLLGAVTLFAGIALLQRAGAALRRSSNLDHLRLWFGLAQTTRGMFPASTALLLASGLYMTGSAWTFTTPWVVVAIATLISMVVVGAGVVGRRFATLGRQAVAAGTGPVPQEISVQLARPGQWMTLSALNGAGIGVLWLMAAKPGWLAALSVIVGLAALGAAAGFAATRKQAVTKTGGRHDI
jgi:hypothetical protein